MLRRIASEKAHSWRRQFYTNRHLFCNSIAPFSSSSSRKSLSSRNYYLRKTRKWPLHVQPLKAQRQETFALQLAKQSIKRSIRKSKSHLLSDLIDSFAAYEVDPTPQIYHFVLKVLTQTLPSNWDKQLSQILDHIEKVENSETPECLFIDLIRFYGAHYMFSEAVELFFRMPKFRCHPSVESLNVLLSVICRNERGIGMVGQVLVKSQVMDIRIEGSSFGVLIRGLCGIGKVGSAFELLNQMVEEGFGVDQKICSLMLATMCRQVNCDCGEITGFLEGLKGLGFEPRKVDFCNLIRALVRKGEGVSALEMLRQMKLNGVKPDITCYNLVLDGLISEREFMSADKVFDELLVLGLVPDICTYNVYISGLCMQSKVDDAIKIMGSMDELGCGPDMYTYSTILKALCETGELDKASEIVNVMRQKGIQLNSLKYESFEVMIDGLMTNGKIDGDVE